MTLAKFAQNQWSEFTVKDIPKSHYGHSISTVFGSTEKEQPLEYDEDDDPVMTHLRFLDYRYIRFCFHPLRDKFALCSNWKDPKWTDVRSVRGGLDGDERYRRELVFGQNQIDIQQKSIPQLLIDEVSPATQKNIFYAFLNATNRLSILFISFKLQALFSGPLTNTIIMRYASSSYLSSVSPRHYWKPDQ